MAKRSCPYCYCTNVKKDGIHRGKQRYYCHNCDTSWVNTARPQRFRLRLFKDYALESRTLKQLCSQYHRSRSLIRKELKLYKPGTMLQRPRKVTVIMDVTYFGSWGVLVVIGPYARTSKGENLVPYYAFIAGTGRTVDYEVATDTFESLGYTILAAVIDGRRGVREMLCARGIAVQQCQFHQLLTVTQCLTKRQKLLQNMELRTIALTLSNTDRPTLELINDRESIGGTTHRSVMTKHFDTLEHFLEFARRHYIM